VSSDNTAPGKWQGLEEEGGGAADAVSNVHALQPTEPSTHTHTQHTNHQRDSLFVRAAQALPPPFHPSDMSH
jgi:hypothetical protein